MRSTLNPENLKSSLDRAGVEYKLIKVPKASTSREAAESLGIELSRIAKTVVLVSEQGEAVVVVVRGDRRVDQAKLARLLGYRKLRLANENEVLEATGYPPGGVPPVGHKQKLPVYVDEELLDGSYYYAGGGDSQHLLLVRAEDILRLAGGRSLKVPKKS